jgi:hypothetical protein
MFKATQVASNTTLFADAGHDSESNHQYCSEESGVRTVILPLHGRPTAEPVQGHDYRLVQPRFNKLPSRQHRQAETVVRRSHEDWATAHRGELTKQVGTVERIAALVGMKKTHIVLDLVRDETMVQTHVVRQQKHSSVRQRIA